MRFALNKMKRTVKLRNMIAFGVGDIYGGGAFFIIGSLFLVFLTDVAGLRASLAGMIIMLGKIWDAVTDPTMGYISDNTKSKHGRRRLYFLLGIVPIFISFAMLWFSFSSEEVAKVIYYLIVYLLFNTVFTMVMVPYNSLPAEMSSEYAVRSKMIGIRMLFSQTGMLLGAGLAMTIVNLFDSQATGYLAMGSIFGLIYALPWYFVYRGTFEREVTFTEDKKGFKESIIQLFRNFGSTYRNKSLRIHIAMYLCAYVAMDIFMALFIYYLRDYLDRFSSYQPLLIALVLTQMVSLTAVVMECRKHGNAKTYRRHLAIWMFGIIIFFFYNSGTSIPLLLVTSAIVGMGLSGAVTVPYNMLAFVVDADEMITRKRREGTYSGMMTFVRKIAQAIALFLVGIGIEAVGYQSSEAGETLVQSSETIMGIRMMFMVAPMILLIVGFMISYGFKINPANHKLMIDEIERLKNDGTKEEVDPETKEVVESITGMDYDALWEE